jgi:NADH:ubiquinone oxidoreductase subunit 3 (subunit A)
MVLYITSFVDKYLLVVMVFLIVGIPIAFISPSSGEIREHPFIPLFYASIAGIIIIIIYSSYKDRRKRQQENRQRRSKK